MPEMGPKNSEPQVAAFGSWKSPVSASLVAGKSLRLGQPCVDGKNVYWTETRPQEGGRCVLVRWTADSGCVDMTRPPYSVQSKVHEYGGGAYTVAGERAWFVNRNDQCIHEIAEGNVRAVTSPAPRSFADLVFDPPRNRLLAICEEHDETLPEPRTSLVAIALATGTVTTLASGCDFYSSPRLSPSCMRLAWLEWNHPDMPWDATELKVGALSAEGQVEDVRKVAGGERESIVQPLWRSDDELLFASDRSDWWNICSWSTQGTRVLLEDDAEYALPHWVFGMQTFALRDSDHLACAYTRDGTWQLGELDLANGTRRDIPLPYTHIEHLDAANGQVVIQAASADCPPVIAMLDVRDQPDVLQSSAQIDLSAEFLQPPSPVSFRTGNGETAHAFYYAPANPSFRGPQGAAPPLLVKVHGGPTAATSPALDLKLRFWTSRGFAVLDINYRGSTGYGRQYRQKLYGKWGVSDVEDCISGARAMAERRLADPERLLISGSSAGGFTVLAALTFHDTFAAGASYYGVADLESAMRDTAKFESRYGDRLVGPLPEAAATWDERSPLLHAGKLKRPVIFFQGLEDRVVPPDQSERMYAAARANGVATRYLPFPGEGHGFRQAATIEAALTAEHDFYCQVLGIETACVRSEGTVT